MATTNAMRKTTTSEALTFLPQAGTLIKRRRRFQLLAAVRIVSVSAAAADCGDTQRNLPLVKDLNDLVPGVESAAW